MLVYVLVGGVLTVTVMVPALRIGLREGWRFLRPKVRGKMGEFEVERCLRKFKGKGFARVKDIMLPSRGKTSQIDNLLISPYGVFVIETKNYGGNVTGSERSANWIQSFPGSRQGPREFFNPIWQNNGHIKALRELLVRDYPYLKYHNVVVFADECKLPSIPGVVTFSELKVFLQSKMNGQQYLSSADVIKIKSLLEENNIKGFKARSEHVSRARTAGAFFKQREKDKIIKQRAEANKDIAMSVQQVYSRARLDTQIKDAEAFASSPRPRIDSFGKSIER